MTNHLWLTVVMPPKTSPGEQAAINQFGAELRRLRHLADLSQNQLATLANVSKQQVGAIERGQRRPTKEFAAEADKALNSHNRLRDLWPGAKRSQPWWFQEYVDIEAKAEVIQELTPQCVPGLLQTENYAAQVLGANYPPLRPQEKQRLLRSRMKRQEIIDRNDPPLLHFIMEEGALRRSVGNAAAMSKQYEHLLKQAQKDNVQIQVLPYDRGAHAGLDGAFIVLRMSLLESLAYAELPGSGQVISDAEVVADCKERFGALRGMALSPAESLDFIASLKE